jgi:hypothetical protein
MEYLVEVVGVVVRPAIQILIVVLCVWGILEVLHRIGG